MLRERIHPDGWLTLVSPKLEAVGVPHGFTTAVGRAGTRWSVASREDLRGVLVDEGLADRSVGMGRQVHGAAWTTSATRSLQGCDEADAHVSDRDDELVAVRTADCVPVLLCRDDGVVVAAVHAGWKGLAAGVIGEAVRIVALGRDASSLVAAVGPCIGVAAYEVGEEVAGKFEHGVVRRSDWPRPHLDLRAISLRQLIEAGLDADRIDVSTRCTFTDAARFGSYRRDGQGCGHQAAYVGPATASAARAGA